nr:hypothetical protein [Alysiella crassa]
MRTAHPTYYLSIPKGSLKKQNRHLNLSNSGFMQSNELISVFYL